MTGCAPVADWGDARKFLLAAQPREAVVDGLPDAGDIGVDLAAAINRTAAGAIHQTLGAAGHRAETAGEMKHAIPAACALLSPLPLFHGAAHAGGVDARVDPGHSPEIGNKVDTNPAGH